MLPCFTDSDNCRRSPGSHCDDRRPLRLVKQYLFFQHSVFYQYQNCLNLERASHTWTHQPQGLFVTVMTPNLFSTHRMPQTQPRLNELLWWQNLPVLCYQLALNSFLFINFLLGNPRRVTVSELLRDWLTDIHYWKTLAQASPSTNVKWCYTPN